ncbi:MAG TPA: DNA repair protein RecO [Gammaproteobacteria bacterium]|nr:DNA repair protein RecO [Gammaproteobacteria bacterium]
MGEPSVDRGFVLHSRRYRENSRIVDILTREHGRISLVARLSASKGGREMAALQVCRESSYQWRGRHELQNLVSVDALRHFPLTGEPSLCALYCNELLLYLLPRQLPCPEVYDAYHDTLAALTETDRPAPPLRRFEAILLNQLGFALDFDIAANAAPEETFYFHPGHGLTRAPTAEDAIALDAVTLEAMRQHRYEQRRTGAVARRIFAATIEQLLEGKPLRSRKLLQSYRKYRP